MEGNEFLAEWAYHYAHHLSVFHGKDESIVRNGPVVSVKGKDYTAEYFAAEDLSEYRHKNPSKGETIYVVTLNTRDNLAALEKDWKKFAEYKNVLVLFLNPKSKLDTKWCIHPYVHNMVCDSTALHTGLKSLFANVDPLKKEDIKALKV